MTLERPGWLKPLGGVAVLAALALTVHALLGEYLAPARLRLFLTAAGSLAPAAFILLYAVRPLVWFPASVFTIAAGLLWGPLWGTASPAAAWPRAAAAGP